MNEYEFEFTTDDCWYSTYRCFAACKVQAYESFIEYLKECDIDPDSVTVLNCYVNNEEDEDHD